MVVSALFLIQMTTTLEIIFLTLKREKHFFLLIPYIFFYVYIYVNAHCVEDKHSFSNNKKEIFYSN